MAGLPLPRILELLCLIGTLIRDSGNEYYILPESLDLSLYQS